MEQQWKNLIEHVSPQVRSLLATLAGQSAGTFSDKFYESILKDPQAATFLTHEAVENRLHASFRRWIANLLTRLDPADIPALVEEQKQIGTIHARLNIRIDLVLRASRHMKEVVLQTVLDHPGRYRARLEAAVLAVSLIDNAVEIMSAQYATAHEAAARTDEAYRSYAATMNMSLERECQRSALFDWSNRLLQDVMIGGRDDLPLPRIGQSSFGLWIRHKAPAVFTGNGELAAINRSLETIDDALLPKCEKAIAEGEAQEPRRVTRLILSEVEQVRNLIDAMFDHLVRIESGRDALTQLLSRRFLPSVLGREIGLARESGGLFSVLLVDIDHFKSINDRYGHDAGDRVLQQVANVLQHATRSGDFVFRQGGEEFLVVCVELDAAAAFAAAERIRRGIADHAIEIADHPPVHVTVSVGIAGYDGHPDYQRLIRQADKALYQAKKDGRNRCVVFREEALAG